MNATANDSEIVIGIIKTVGTNIKQVKDNIIDRLNHFNYHSMDIKVSNQIISEFVKGDELDSEYHRISFYMDQGNRIRKETNDESILMKGVISKILMNRDDPNNPSPKKRMAYIIDSIKHPEEVNFLRKTYGSGFHLIGITSTIKRRKKYLIDEKGLSEEESNEILERDANESDKHGQHTQDAFQDADYFVNVSDNTDEIRANVYRLIDLLFGDPFITPTFNEYAMFMAYASSLRSADLSRQIGSVIAKDNEIIASGVNDCPKFGGGLYWPEFNDNNYVDIEGGRDYMLGYDSNKIEQKNIITSILDNLEVEKSEDNINKIKKAGIGNLTEYGRVVHSEMEALLMCSRNNISCKGASMYVTTFPCHNCAKHIIAAGIKEVIYIEPYPKSKAMDFYKEEISENLSESNKVHFVPFIGVGPHRFVDLFSTSSIQWYKKIRKNKDGYIISWDQKSANVRNPMNVFSYLDSELAAYDAYREIIKNINLIVD
ncbi:anti-phage dCTP deaminase [Tissierella sp. Yu-01]|uniref:anti-phage dCTP deaminase n=1 Tax=Tissierella sp. Yu-01 TaxID=3035694 RepID=UPI00240DED00|nr:anti-phage dCTP deaminase [Tissierella sp. Yu-01]WFA08543.1 anti-phage dCTP deaminase [Tissierella sp. Yu-01]